MSPRMPNSALARICMLSVKMFGGQAVRAGINAGFIALAVNGALAVGISLALGKKPDLSR